MYNNSSDVASSEPTVDIFKEEFRELDEIIFESDMRDLICLQFGFCEDVYLRLMECGMDTESLLLIKDDDMKEIFPTNMLGTRIKFRSRVSQWRQQLKTQKFNPSMTVLRTVATPTRVIPRTVTSPPRVASPPRYNIHQSSLFDILQSCPKGQTVLKYFEENSKILDEHRILLVNIIVDFHKDRSIAMSMSDIVRFTEEIGVLFPTEEKRYYYSTRGKGLNPMGKLYDKAINARRKVKKQFSDIFANSKKNTNTNNDSDILIASKDELDKKNWLSQNKEPWVEIVNNWKLTFRIRRDEILKGENILLNWPLFNTPMGYKLIDIDFAELFPESPKDMLEEWEFFRENIGPYLREKIKDPDSKELMEKLNDDITTDSKDCLIVFLLHAVIKPPLLSTKLLSPENGNKRRKWKPSISDAQTATVLHCTSMGDYQYQYERLKSEACQKNKIIQPVVVVIGEDLTQIEEFYVLHNCVLYKINTFIKAVDILFKLYYVMNLEFRLEAKYLYELIESYFFKIKISSNPNIISLTNYLNDSKYQQI